MILLRRTLGEVLRRHRNDQHRTLRDVSDAARVSLGYLSEVERGQKEPSSELLSSICGALATPLSAVLREVSDDMVLAETEAATEAAAAARRAPTPVLSRRVGGRLVVAPRVPIPPDDRDADDAAGTDAAGTDVQGRLTGAAA